jgi:hypothetical protein
MSRIGGIPGGCADREKPRALQRLTKPEPPKEKPKSEAKVSGTPTFLVNGIVVVGADIESLKKAIEKEKK